MKRKSYENSNLVLMEPWVDVLSFNQLLVTNESIRQRKKAHIEPKSCLSVPFKFVQKISMFD